MGNAKILVVDDEIIIARELEMRLEGLGHQVVGIASSGPEAVQMANEKVPDLILMDIVLKGDMDGIEAATEIRRNRNIPVLYVTAYTDKETLERAAITEPFGYIVKPFSERELEANIEIALYKHRVEMRLRKVERWFADTVNGFPSAVVAADNKGNITFFNRMAEVITKWPQEEALGKKMTEVLQLSQSSEAKPILLGDLENGPVATLADETVLTDRSNGTIPIDLAMSSLRDINDEPQGIVSVFWDAMGESRVGLANITDDVTLATTQSMTLQAMLQLCMESLVRNLDGALARIWVANDASGHHLILQASAGLAAAPEDEADRIPVGEGLIGGISESRTPYLTNNIANDPHLKRQTWVKKENIVSFVGYPLVIEERLVGVMAFYAKRNLSERIVESLATISRTIAGGIERKKLENRFLKSQKMEAIGQLAGGIAHDFNNLLTIINGGSEMLLEGLLEPEERESTLRQIAEAGKRAEGVTRQLLAFSRNQAFEVEVLDLNEAISKMTQMILRFIGEDIVFTTKLDPTLCSVLADVGRLEQILINLSINARDAMPSGGNLTIETQNRVLDRNHALTHPDLKPGEYALLAVSDTGRGMPQEVANRIFEPFFTTKEVGKGTGLGLSMVFGIVKQFNGDIEVYSEVGIGTTFKIYLPAAETHDQSKMPEVDLGTIPLGTETVLLVEDDESVRSLCARILEGCGYHVISACDGHEGLKICEKYINEIDLVLTDVVMPKLGGRAFSEQVNAMKPGIPILYMSGYTDDAVVRHGIIRVDANFIQKPFTPDSLARVVRKVLDEN